MDPLQKLDELSKLQEGWDSYDAKSIAAACIERARGCVADALCDDPHIVPTTAGGVQLEWSSGSTVERALVVAFWTITGVFWIHGATVLLGGGE